MNSDTIRENHLQRLLRWLHSSPPATDDWRELGTNSVILFLIVQYLRFGPLEWWEGLLWGGAAGLTAMIVTNRALRILAGCRP